MSAELSKFPQVQWGRSSPNTEGLTPKPTASNIPLRPMTLLLSPSPTAGPGQGVGSTELRVLHLRSTVSHAGVALTRPGSEASLNCKPQEPP